MRDPQHDENLPWLELQLIQGVGNVAYKNLLTAFGSPGNVFGAHLSDLLNVAGIRRDMARNIRRRTFSRDPEEVLKTIEAENIRLLTYADAQYPPLLRETHSPPMILYAKGEDIPPRKTLIAIVGSRRCTPYGLKSADKISRESAWNGLGVVSGMARGVDTAAHWGCLNQKGLTIAVLGTGLDIVYPAGNRALYETIAERGVLLSEFPPGSPPEPRNFPIRNRIISGLCRGVVVAEATLKSGSLITASTALEQGREVFAVPGNIHSRASAGCHFLLKNGAALVEGIDDVLNGLCLPCTGRVDAAGERHAGLPPLDDSEQSLLKAMGEDPLHIDEIAAMTGLSQPRVSCLLMTMELKGVIRQLPGKRFLRDRF